MRIASYEGSVDRADGNPGSPVGMKTGLCQSLIDACLICAEGTAPLQQKRNAFEGRSSPPLRMFRYWIRKNMFVHDDFLSPSSNDATAT